MIVIDRDAIWILELAWLDTFLAELGHERAVITREYLHSMVVAITDEQETSMMVEHQAPREVELAIIKPGKMGANRELDSSITIEIFHLNDAREYKPTPANQEERERERERVSE